MSPQSPIEERLSSLEREVAQLKSRLNEGNATGSWVDAVSGRFEGDDAFREILRLGKEERDSQHDDGEG